jgi:hypothetical protein
MIIKKSNLLVKFIIGFIIYWVIASVLTFTEIMEWW